MQYKITEKYEEEKKRRTQNENVRKKSNMRNKQQQQQQQKPRPHRTFNSQTIYTTYSILPFVANKTSIYRAFALSNKEKEEIFENGLDSKKYIDGNVFMIYTY